MPLHLSSILTFTRDISPFSQRHYDALNEVADTVMALRKHYGDLEMKLMEPDDPIEASEFETVIEAQVTGFTGTDWPKLYQWEEIEFTGSGADVAFQTLQDGRNSDTLESAINRNELLNGFGVHQGPWGADIQLQGGSITILPIPNDQPIEIRLLDSTDSEGAPIKIPIFTGENTFTIVCTSLSPPGGGGIGDIA